jgi:acetylornithine deacetylase
VDSLKQIELTRTLIDIDSTTGREGEAGRFIAATLRDLGYTVVEQPVTADRCNIFASPAPAPVVVFSTHFDCVPPFFPSREEGARLYGRGACDAKGILVSQIAAAERLRSAGETRVGLLFVVGEERGSDGAKLANTIAAGSRFLINGEPTGNRLGRATRGVYRARLVATGRAAHTSQPALGISAIDKLIDALLTLRNIEWPDDQVLGRTFYSIGLIKGGVAPNVVSPDAQAELMFRTVGDHQVLRSLMTEAVGHLVEIEDVLVVPPVSLTAVAGFETSVFSFTTDIPFLGAWGSPLLVGPGSVTVAHTAEEHVELRDLADAVDLYVGLARDLLSQAG